MRALICNETGRHHQTKRCLEQAILEFENSGAYDRAYRVREYEAYSRAARGEYLYGLAAAKDAARQARRAGCVIEEAHAYYNVGIMYRALSDFAYAQRYFRKSVRFYRTLGATMLEARSLRCVARMSIRMYGDCAAIAMDAAKELFLSLRAAGEVCRSTVAIMQELLRRDSAADIRPYCNLLEEEALTSGVLSYVRATLERLSVSAEDRVTTEEQLQNIWDAFGPSSGQTSISSVTTVEH